VLSVPELSESTEKAFAALLDLVGFQYDREGPKADAMSGEITALGVVFDLSDSSLGLVRVRNTEKRVEEITAKISETIASTTLTAGAAATLKGRLGFAEGQLFGRTARRLINDLGSFALSSRGRSAVTEDLRESLSSVSKMLVSGKPREINTKSHEIMYIYTDASYCPEEKNGGIGGVLCASGGSVVSWFGAELDPEFCSKFKSEGQTQVIGELEAFAVLVALKRWKCEISSKHLVIFVDNEGSKYAILRGYSKNETLTKIVAAISRTEDSATVFCWYSRVPSESNPSDKPSRGLACEEAPAGSQISLDRSWLEAVVADLA
jgi:ribonuclease HI